MKKLRTLKLFFGSLLLGLFVSGCGNVKDTSGESDSKPTQKCYKEDSALVADSLARVKKINDADSARKADSMKAKPKKKAKKKTPTNDPTLIMDCYKMVSPRDSQRQ